MTVCSPFQKRVLLTEAKIPRGFISTYGRIAARLGMPAGARAVGHALAMNPFPLIMPCHRTVGSHGALSGFQDGLEMKRTLLLQEGIKFLKTGKAIMNKVYFLQGKPSPLVMVP
jgi:methylated-DNA-[protein]-cysteine S-methyltransferase